MSWKDTITETRNNLRELNKVIPEATKGFAGLSQAVKENGALSFKEKEYVALGIAVATHCTPCIAFHVEALIKIGATRDEVADVLAMCIQMAGGPGLMISAEALAIYDELAAA